MVFQKGNTISIGKKLSEETKKKLSDSKRGRHFSPETEFKKGMTPWSKGRKLEPLSKETREKMSKAHSGKKHTEEHVRKVAEANKGKTRSEEQKLKQSIAMTGRIHSEETKQKISNAGKKRKHTTASKLKMSLSKIGTKAEYNRHPLSQEHRQKISDANKGRPKSAETKLKLSIAHRGKVLTEEHKQNISRVQKGKIVSKETIKKISGENANNWKGGISFIPYCLKFNRQLKERIRKRDNRTCQLCGINENGIKLDVHHIHYDKPNCNPDLISLCKSCNAKVNFKREYWEAYFINLLIQRGLLL